MHEVRAFDQHGRSGLHLLPQRGHQRLQPAKMFAARAEIAHCQQARLTQRQQAVNPLALGVAAYLVVILAAHVTDFAHVTEHQNSASGNCR